MTTEQKPTANHIAQLFGCDPSQVKSQFSRNGSQLRALSERAAKIGGKFRGKTAQEWNELADYAEQAAQ